MAKEWDTGEVRLVLSAWHVKTSIRREASSEVKERMFTIWLFWCWAWLLPLLVVGGDDAVTERLWLLLRDNCSSSWCSFWWSLLPPDDWLLDCKVWCERIEFVEIWTWFKLLLFEFEWTGSSPGIDRTRDPVVRMRVLPWYHSSRGGGLPAK